MNRTLFCLLVLASLFFASASGGDYTVPEYWTSSSGAGNETILTSPESAADASGSDYSATIGPLKFDLPVITAQSPSGSSSYTSFDLSCSATDADWLSSITFYAGTSSSTTVINSQSLSGHSASASYTYTPTSIGALVWNCYVCDGNGLCSWGQNMSLTKLQTTTTITVSHSLSASVTRYCIEPTSPTRGGIYNNGVLNVSVVDDKGDPLSTASVSISGVSESSVYTDRLGEASFSSLANGGYRVTVWKPGYGSPTTTSVTLNCENCPSPSPSQTKEHATWDITNCVWNCDRGYVLNESTNNCDATGTTTQNQTQSNQTTQTNQSSGQVTNQTIACESDVDCANDEICKSGICSKIFGNCGYVSNHQWINYVCCDNSQCTDIEKCENHVCVKRTFTISVPDSAKVGDTVNLTVFEDGVPTNITDALISLTLPSGSSEKLKINKNGQVTVKINQEGEYLASLMKGEGVLTTAEFNSKYRTSKGLDLIYSTIEENKNATIIIVISLVLVGAYIYFRPSLPKLSK